MTKVFWRPLAASALLVLGLGACSGDGDGDEGGLDDVVDSRPTEQDGSAGTDDRGGDRRGDDESDDRGRDDRGDGGSDDRESDDRGSGGGSPGEPIGTATGQQPADPGDGRMVPLRLDVTGLERNGDLVELHMVLTNVSDTADLTFEPWAQFGSDAPGGTYDLAGIGLVDQAEQKLYLPVLDSEGNCLCTGDLSDVAIGPGESAELDATFGGLPDDVEALDLHVPGLDPVTGLEVAG